jgi:hypothetical protein
MTFTEKIRNDFVHLKTLAKHNSLWIAGDFNLPDINWNNMTIEGSTYPNHINKSFIDIVQDLCMEQIVDFPTRLDNTLDLVFTTHKSLVYKCKPLPGISDHDIVLVDTNIRINRTKQTKRKIYLRKLTNMDELRTEVQIKLNDFMAVSFLTIDNMWIAFKDIILNVMEKHVPSKLSRSKQTYPWITTEVRKIINKKNKAGRKVRKTNNQKDRDRFRKLKAEAQKTARKAYNNYIHDIIGPDQTGNSKRFWSFIKAKKQEHSGVARLRGNDGMLHSASNNKAEILNAQFKSTYTQEDLTNLPDVGRNIIPKLQEIRVMEKGVLKLLQNLKVHKAAGPDTISPRLLNSLASVITPDITRIFRTSLDEGTVPKDWRKANIVPVFKKGDKSKPANYRPVSLEHIIYSNIMNHLSQNNILSDN